MKLERPKRYGWFRTYNDFPFHPKWAAVADRTKVELARVLAIVTVLEVCANKGKPRGSVANFSAEDCAAGLRIPVTDVRRVYRCLEQRGWIDREYLVTWDTRQPDREDPTAAARSARYREKKRAERTASTGRHAVTSVTVTPKTQTQTESLTAEVRALDGAIVPSDELAAKVAGWMPPKQRALPLPPVELKQRRGIR